MPEPIAKFWQKIAKAKTLSVTVKEWADDGRVTGDNPRVLILNNVAEVKIQRPNLISILGQPPRMEETPKEGGLSVKFSGGGKSYISDGKSAIELTPEFHAYQPAKPIETVTQNKNNPLNGLFLYWVLSNTPMAGLKPHTTDRTPQPRVFGTVYVLKDTKGSPREEWHYFDAKTGNLMRWSAYHWGENGHVYEDMRIEYQFWEFDPKLPKNTFDTHPPKNWKPFPARPKR